ncbi:hypothetical protein [Roseimaritima ulvae]|uniref:Uncharacterized protein n=1 Tax=Roseimaritima ulvae TaxID=980254 RepID=A0A5B9R3X2_9BACT|nr:hypothetical protein [Roseimaritima ulvae]QEG41003.1 hypothetical protein UC8_30210 [Roseimaritima ulvae]
MSRLSSTIGYDDEDRLVGWERADSNLDQSWDLSLVEDRDSLTSSEWLRRFAPALDGMQGQSLVKFLENISKPLGVS